MSDQDQFTALIGRIRAGDDQAATELVRQYEPLIRREVRLHLEDRRLCRLFDSMDVCQSVLASFFVRTAAGQYDLHHPGQLVKLLVTMARNKLSSAARRQHSQRRDQRRNIGAADDNLHLIASGETSPGDKAANKELLARVQEQLNDEERTLAELRGQGLGWAEIAAKMGSTPEARRRQFARAMDRVSQALGIEEDLHE